MQQTQTTTNRKSVRFQTAEVSAFKKYMKSFDTVTEAAEFAGVSKQVIDRIQYVLRCSPESMVKLKTAMAAKGFIELAPAA